MQNNKLLAFSILCLSVAIIISSSIIANGIANGGNHIGSGLSIVSSGLSSIGGSISSISNNTGNEIYGNTLNAADAAKYLGISIEDLFELTRADSSGIPYIKIGYSYIFGREALDKWLEKTRFELKQ